MGCAGLWDDVTSKDFEVQALFFKPDPLKVLEKSNDGDKRARALRDLSEPKQSSGTDAEQDLYIKILTTAANNDAQPLCRLAAIQTLGHYKDPRAVQALLTAFGAAAERFPPDTATIIQCQALHALGETQSPGAVDLLVRVVREPRPASDVTEQEKQQSLDRRTAAARSLGNFKEGPSVEALVYVLQNEKDIALKDSAHDSLVKATGKDLPKDPQAWQDYLAKEQSKPDTGGSKIKLLNWTQKK